MSQFNTLSPEFRESLRILADALEKKQAAAAGVIVRVAMDQEVKIEQLEGTVVELPKVPDSARITNR